MGKHGKKKDETSKNPVIKALNPKKDVPTGDRISQDIRILDKGWSSTQEAEDFKNLSAAEYRKKYHNGGKHS